MISRATWPLAQCISPGALAKLMEYQEKHHDQTLQIPGIKEGPQDGVNISVKLESQEEIVKLMKQRPNPVRIRNL